jgi:hypothetical protein
MSGAHVMKHSGPPPQVHAPPLHPSAVPPQSLPHEPQLSTLLLVLMQVLPQHDSAPPQVRPQAPQLATVFSVVHAPPQHD